MKYNTTTTGYLMFLRLVSHAELYLFRFALVEDELSLQTAGT